MSARDRLIQAWFDGVDASVLDVVATITTEAELASYVAGMKHRAAYTDEVAHAVETRRFQLQKSKGVSWRS